MPTFRYVVADVFTDAPLAGNQLAVFTDAREIPDEQLQPLARELNLSETVFVYPPEAGRSRAAPDLHAGAPSCRSRAIRCSGPRSSSAGRSSSRSSTSRRRLGSSRSSSSGRARGSSSGGCASRCRR